MVSKVLFIKHFPTRDVGEFTFSNGWFQEFLRWHQISLRFATNKSSQLPKDFGDAILNWLRFDRRNSFCRTGEFEAIAGRRQGGYHAGRYMLQNICNMDQTPIPFQYLEGRTYNQQGEKTIWIQSSRSGWDKRQGTIQLTVFADGVPRVKPLLLFPRNGHRSLHCG